MKKRINNIKILQSKRGKTINTTINKTMKRIFKHLQKQKEDQTK
jgi:hypothetical protein